jgi:hypothetical protein
MTVHSLIEVTKILLTEGLEYALSEKFCQNLLVAYFRHQHSSRGGYSANPTVQSFGYNDLTNAAQHSIAPVLRGNVMGQHKRESSKWVVSEEPLPKRKRKSSQKKK